VGGEYVDGNWTQVSTKSLDYQASMLLPDAIPLIFSFPWNDLTLSLMSEPQARPASLYSDTITMTPYVAGQTILPGVIPTSLFLQNVDINGQFTPETAIFQSAATESSYSWQSNIYGFTTDQLNGDTTINNPTYTQLPPDLPVRIKQLAEQITALATTPYEKASAIATYLRTNYTYKYGIDDPLYNTKPPAQDPVDWFLFDHKIGTCGNFSSAFVVLARSIGLPARVVSGWVVSATAEQQVVYADQAHQWAEVAFANLGWITFEATAPGGAPSRVEQTSTTTTTTSPASTTTASTTTTTTTTTTATTRTTTTTTPTTTTTTTTTTTATTATPTSTATTTTTTTSPPTTTPVPGTSQAATATVITSVAPVVDKGKTFNVIGTVKTISGAPLDGLPVEIYINPQKVTNGGTLVGQGTVANGTFNITAEVPNTTGLGNYQMLANCLGNAQYAGSWSDPTITVVTDTIITLTVPAQVKAGEPVTIQGTLTESDATPIPEQNIDISINGVAVTQAVTDANGQFRWAQTFSQTGNNTLEAGFAGTDYQLPSSQTVMVKVLIPTVINLQMPNKVQTGKSMIITGTLVQDKTLASVASQPVTVSANGQTISNKLLTGQNGGFMLSHTFNKAGSVEIEASFAGDTTYAAAQAQNALEVDAAGPRKMLLWIIGGSWAVLAILAAGAFFWVRLRKKDAPAPVQPGGQPTIAAQVVAISKNPNGYTLKIEFPQIGPAFPDVWGSGDELEIAFLLLGPDGQALTDKFLEITIGAETRSVTTDQRGAAKIIYQFREKGEYLIKAGYAGGARNEAVESARALRIVDYREEIVSLFKTLTARLRSAGVSFAPEATPREIQRATLGFKEGIPAEPLENSISYFEEADFSTHAITRGTYEKMYLAEQSITQYEPSKNNNN
jgi:transglutaminase-like putative cysteine protease